jgi:exodeoxyribonuclease V beta subunit
MTESFYRLQYHLYVVAIHKYLAARLPGYRYDSHFGGVYYVFLRGVDPEKGSDYGIYRHRPAAASIEALCTNLIGTVAP